AMARAGAIGPDIELPRPDRDPRRAAPGSMLGAVYRTIGTFEFTYPTVWQKCPSVHCATRRGHRPGRRSPDGLLLWRGAPWRNRRRSEMSRTAAEWNHKPNPNAIEWVDSRIYTDEAIFEQELEKIWKRVWVLACHESELPKAYDFRTLTVAREPIVICRGEDDRIRAFLNVCPHRANLIVRAPAGSFEKGEPSGNPKRMTCMFHGWQFDMKGNCVEIPRCKQGYQDRLVKKDAGLRELRCVFGYGGC